MTIAAQTGQKPGFVPLLSFYLFYRTAVKFCAVAYDCFLRRTDLIVTMSEREMEEGSSSLSSFDPASAGSWLMADATAFTTGGVKMSPSVMVPLST